MQDLRTLVIFVKVAERQSFVRAAAELGITQSGVSNAISRLEQQLGTRLLARTTRRVNLTEHGAAYFERCRQALAELEEAELVLKDSQLEPSGNLRIDMPVSFGRLKVVPLLGPFQAKYPHIKLRVTFTDRYIDLIEEGVDVCMRLGPLHDSSLIARRLSGAGFTVVGSPRYLAKFGKPKRIEDLTDHNCLAFTFRETRLARAWRFMQEGVEKASHPRAIWVSATVRQSVTPPALVTGSHNFRIISPTPQSRRESLFRYWIDTSRTSSQSGSSIRRRAI
jgi:LysR family transcriptional regulator for bpeEF and oprC